ncbi:adenylate kinase, putative [Theileria annulata]|uniref:Adenylate kinase, putative n=1 Tax=Theileria annulata TaxID=5874 RepID=Q4UHG4_THEAN|nr:adenylate kinase, putative [Theileria annulata]CAI73475.1 adenylate kinase, putative [Theileria annulata]|eukprot:XP_954152.1 adenylate kinase, putative [Theileria annulata]
MANLEDYETTDLLSELKRRYNCLGKPQGNFVFLGPPGSGKGTQSHILKNSHCYCHVSTGDLFREAIKSGTPLGLKAKEFIDKGLLVPDDLTLSLVQERINSPKCRRGFLLDGYPRNISQAKDLGKLLKSVGKKLNGVFSFNASDEVIEKRVVGRLVHPGSNRVYHKVFKPPKEEGKDDLTGEPLITRKDDSPDIIRKRLEVYKKETAPLVEYYNNENLHHSVNANNSVESITKVIFLGFNFV